MQLECRLRIPTVTAKSSVVAAPASRCHVLADRGFANHELMGGYKPVGGNYCLRLPSLWCPAARCQQVSEAGWQLVSNQEKLACTAKCVYGQSECIAVIRLATVQEPESWAVVTDVHLPCKPMAVCAPVSSRRIINGIASQAHLRREDFAYALVAALERLYLVAALALLYATTQECL